MIPLCLPIETDAEQAFVAKLGGCSGGLDDDAVLVAEFDDHVVYSHHGALIFAPGVNAETLAGDVVYVDPASSSLQRWLRRGSDHNTLLVTERCDQLCVMCSQPPRKTHVDQFAAFREACRLADPGTVIGLSGGEPTLYKAELFDLLDASLSERSDLSFHVLSNGQHFEDADIPRLRRFGPGKVRWGIPLYAAAPDLHDAIVAKPGAFARLEASLARLMRAGAEVELRTVVLQANATALPRLADYVTARLPFLSVWAIMQLEHAGFARNRWSELLFDHARDFTPIAAALETAWLRGLPVALYNFPRCTVPPTHRRFAVASISDWKRLYLPACGDCREQSSCSGFFAWRSPGDDGWGVSPL